MFLEINDNQKSNYVLKRNRKQLFSYDWFYEESGENQRGPLAKAFENKNLIKYLTGQIYYKHEMIRHKQIYEKLKHFEMHKNKRKDQGNIGSSNWQKESNQDMQISIVGTLMTGKDKK